jgi:hypothetical protein
MQRSDHHPGSLGRVSSVGESGGRGVKAMDVNLLLVALILISVVLLAAMSRW